MALGMTALALTLVGVGTQAYGAWRAGREAKRVGEAQERVAESEAGLLDYNARVAELQAKDAVERGREEESRFRIGVKGMIGTTRAEIGASGTDVTFGSAVDVQADQAFLGELDALTIRTNAARQAWGYQVEAVDYRERARITRAGGKELSRAGRESQRAARIGAVGGAALTGASLLESRYGFAPRTT